MKKYILGVGVDDISLTEALNKVSSWMEKPEKRYIVTPNPEFIMEAQNDNVFKDILNRADLGIPDGNGLILGGIRQNLPGVDLMDKLSELAAKNDWSIGLLGGRDGVVKDAKLALEGKYPKLSVSWVSEGDVVAKDGSTKTQQPTPNEKIDILFVAFGHPKQEKWIVKNMLQFPAQIFIGVGGSFDYISGRVKRAPKALRKLKLEWLFRLVLQPWRIRRQIKLLEFVWLIVLEKLGLRSS